METDTKEIDCQHCGLKCKNQAGLKEHLHLKHSIEKTTDLSCWTCGKLFSQELLLNQHYKTVLHQINCKNAKKEMSEKPLSIEEIIKNHKEDRERKKLIEKDHLEQDCMKENYPIFNKKAEKEDL